MWFEFFKGSSRKWGFIHIRLFYRDAGFQLKLWSDLVLVSFTLKASPAGVLFIDPSEPLSLLLGDQRRGLVRPLPSCAGIGVTSNRLHPPTKQSPAGLVVTGSPDFLSGLLHCIKLLCCLTALFSWNFSCELFMLVVFCGCEYPLRRLLICWLTKIYLVFFYMYTCEGEGQSNKCSL